MQTRKQFLINSLSITSGITLLGNKAFSQSQNLQPLHILVLICIAIPGGFLQLITIVQENILMLTKQLAK